MTGIRDQRAAAIRRHWRDLGDSLDRALPALLDDLDAIDAEHARLARIAKPAAPAPASVPPLISMPPTAAPAAKPAPRRRTPK